MPPRLCGGTLGALNARLFGVVAQHADEHRFDAKKLGALLDRLPRRQEQARREQLSDDEVRHEIRLIRQEEPGISRTLARSALRKNRLADTASRVGLCASAGA